MPDWQRVEEAYASLLKVRSVFDDALALVVEGRNAGALAVLELLATEVENLTAAVLGGIGQIAGGGGARGSGSADARARLA